MKQQFSLTPCEEDGAIGARLVLRPKRGPLTGVGLLGPFRHFSLQRDQLVIEASWSPPLRAGAKIELVTDCAGEPRELGGLSWTFATRGPVVTGNEPFVGILRSSPALDDQRLVERLWEARRETIEQIPDADHRRYSRFFELLDVNTNSNYWKSKAAGIRFFDEDRGLLGHRDFVLALVTQELIDRTVRRADLARQGHEFVRAGEADDDLKAGVTYLSMLQRSLYLSEDPRCFRVQKGNLDFSDVANALRVFANGELNRGTLTAGVPDSGFVFFFAEFAFLAIECGIHVDFWTPMLPGLVSMQPIYLRRYDPSGDASGAAPRPAHYSEFKPENAQRTKPIDFTLIAKEYDALAGNLPALNKRASTNTLQIFQPGDEIGIARP